MLPPRAVLGLGFGGEWAAGAVLMGEAIRPQYRGRAVGSVQSGWAVGWGLAVLSQAVLFSLMPAETAWRWMFVIGALPATTTLANAIAMFAVVAYTVFFIAAFALPETRGRVLHADS